MNMPLESAALPAPAQAKASPSRLQAWLQLAGGRHAGVLGGFSLPATLLLALAHTFTREPIPSNHATQLIYLPSNGAKITEKPNLAAFRTAVQPVYAKAREKYGADVDAFLKDAEAIRKSVK